MNGNDSAFPAFPPGFWRRIALHPRPGVVIGGLEDDAHRFVLRLAHEDGRITGVDARAERFPWSTCADAGTFLAGQLRGSSLQAVAALDPRSHCTHLFDLAILCAAHAHEPAPIRFDLKVAERVERRTSATLLENDAPVLQWQVNGTLIEGPGDWAGRDMRELSSWKQALSAAAARRATMLRRAIYVSGVRAQPATVDARASDRGPGRLGACFTYQMPRVGDAVQSRTARVDFSQGQDGPLQDFDPERLVLAGGADS
jgi:hypothetical protein